MARTLCWPSRTLSAVAGGAVTLCAPSAPAHAAARLSAAATPEPQHPGDPGQDGGGGGGGQGAGDRLGDAAGRADHLALGVLVVSDRDPGAAVRVPGGVHDDVGAGRETPGDLALRVTEQAGRGPAERHRVHPGVQGSPGPRARHRGLGGGRLGGAGQHRRPRPSGRRWRTRRCRSPAAAPGSPRRPGAAPRPRRSRRHRKTARRCRRARPAGSRRSGRRASRRAAGSGRTAGKMSPAGSDRHRLLTSHAMICRCSAALRCRGSSWTASPVSETIRPTAPKMAAVSAAVVPAARDRRRGGRTGRAGRTAVA